MAGQRRVTISDPAGSTAPDSLSAEQVAAGPNGRLVAVVVTFRRLDQLKITLGALLAQPARDLSAVLIVDNASNDGTAEWLAAQGDPRLVTLALPENRGGAGGFEAGMRHAVEHLAPDWIVVMDDDARPEPGAFAAFQALDLGGFDGFAAAVRHPDGTLCEMNRPTFNPFWHKKILARTLLGGGRGAFHLGPEDFERPGLRRVDGASFVGFFVRAGTVRLRGYPDPALFLYGDDAIYTMELTKAGHAIGFEPSVRFEHDSSTYSNADPRIRPLWKVYYYHRNLLILYRIATGVFFVPVLMLYLPRWLLRLRHHKGERGTFLRLFGLAIADGLRRRTERSHAEILRRAQGRGSEKR
ncbi:glycosyltransferase [Rhodobacter sp. NTK016B]|nr:glycosyltransferase [Rhodobacter sp. NTK016B]MBN8292998.1 glycosyltransferase [Rhodobacter sp. NTK016B]